MPLVIILLAIFVGLPIAIVAGVSGVVSPLGAFGVYIAVGWAVTLTTLAIMFLPVAGRQVRGTLVKHEQGTLVDLGSNT